MYVCMYSKVVNSCTHATVTLFLLLQDIAIRSDSVLYVYPVETAKTSVYYAMQFLKVHLPNVVIKVLSYQFGKATESCMLTLPIICNHAPSPISSFGSKDVF